MLQVENKHQVQRECQENALQETDELAGSRVMVVDDSPLARRQMHHYLQKAGYEVFEAKSGEEAIYLSNEVKPDLILMDVMMDGISGFEACERLRGNPEHADTPIIFLTGLSDRDEIVRGFSSGGVDYITKPFHPAEGMSRIQTHLRMCKLARFRKQHIDELENLNKTKDRLLQVASHDLRNPLSSICGLAEFLQEDNPDLKASHQESLDCIQQTARRMTHLVNDLLDLSALESGNLKLEQTTFDIAEQVNEICLLYKKKAEEKGIHLQIQSEVEFAHVYGDPKQLMRVVDNLIGNALKFTPQGGEVLILWDLGFGSTVLKIMDSGPGIVAEDRKQLFHDFGRTRNRPTGNEPSTGLGLSICKRLLDAHGGDIVHSNRPEGGSCFTVTLPRRG